MRKDIDYDFEMLKVRWKILKLGIRVIGLEKYNNIFLIYCTLYNILLEKYNLDDF